MSCSRWSSLFFGAVLFYATTTLCLLLGMGLGLSFIPVEELDGETAILGIGLLGALSLVAALSISATFASYISSRVLREDSEKNPVSKQPLFHGLGLWSLILLIQIASASWLWGPTFAQGLGFAGAGMGAISFWEEFRKTAPRVVSDLKLLDGKVVTTLELGKNATLPKVAERAEKNTEKALNEKNVEKARKVIAGLSLLGFIAALSTLLSSIAGSYWGFRSPSKGNNRS